jgi:hypothetical protein
MISEVDAYMRLHGIDDPEVAERRLLEIQQKKRLLSAGVPTQPMMEAPNGR